MGSAQAVHDDLHDALRLAEHPFGFGERRSQAFESLAGRLMAGRAEAGISLTSVVEQGLLFVRKRLGDRHDHPGLPGQMTVLLNQARALIIAASLLLETWPTPRARPRV
jgi:hypothetical protein